MIASRKSLPELNRPIQKTRSRKRFQSNAEALFSEEVDLLDRSTTSMLRAVLDEVCAEISRSETTIRTHVASKLLECAGDGELSIDDLRDAGRQALRAAPTVWR
jgi:hypothetical protein